jgi:hypothetical protein
MRKPSSTSINATLYGAVSRVCTTVVACTVPSPWLTRHSRFVLPDTGAITRGKKTGLLSSIEY